MWFKVLSLLIMALCIGKATIALGAPHTFYRLRRRQYASATIPGSILLPPLAVLMLASVAWYATLLHYTAWGWIVTGFLTLISLLAVVNLFRWSQHRMQLLAAIAEEQAPSRQRVDVGLLVVGLLFGALGIVVF